MWLNKTVFIVFSPEFMIIQRKRSKTIQRGSKNQTKPKTFETVLTSIDCKETARKQRKFAQVVGFGWRVGRK